jgi:drug/metabolite transporter (DMT)-like permease
MKTIKYSFILLVTAAIWGFSFVAQKSGMEHIGPFTFNGVRFAIGSLSLIPLYLYLKRKKSYPIHSINKKARLQGLYLGLVLFLAASLQQIGMIYTSAAKGGFITSLYVVLVPLFWAILGKRIRLNIWFAVVLTLLGLYLLSFKDNLIINTGDALILMSALFWAIHIMLIETFVQKSDVILLSVIQFGITAFLSLMIALFLEEYSYKHLQLAAIPILYAGLCSVGIAYTLQIFAQKKVPSEVAAIVLSFESAFAMLGGWLILGEQHQPKALMGAALMLIGIILSQIKIR